MKKHTTRFRFVASKESLEEKDMSIVDAIIECFEETDEVRGHNLRDWEDRNPRERIAWADVHHEESSDELDSMLAVEDILEENYPVEGNVASSPK